MAIRTKACQITCLQKEVVVAVSLKGSTAWNIDGKPFAACLPLACKSCRRASRGSFRGCIVYLDLGEEDYIVLYPKNLAEMDVFHPDATFCSALDTSCRILTAGGGKRVCGAGSWKLDLETPNLLFCSRDCESAQRLQFFSSSEGAR